MKTQRSFRPEFKRQVIKELLSGISSPAQIIRRYEISSGLLYHWKKQYAKGADQPSSKTILHHYPGKIKPVKKGIRTYFESKI